MGVKTANSNQPTESGKDMTTNVNINGYTVTISTRQHATRFGLVFTASNSYGEPKQNVVGFKTPLEAVENEKRELAAILS
jgi:hypothetical protein